KLGHFAFQEEITDIHKETVMQIQATRMQEETLLNVEASATLSQQFSSNVTVTQLSQSSSAMLSTNTLSLISRSSPLTQISPSMTIYNSPTSIEIATKPQMRLDPSNDTATPSSQPSSAMLLIDTLSRPSLLIPSVDIIQVPKALVNVPVTTICKFARKSWRYMNTYNKGLEGRTAEWAVNKYKSHHRLPENIEREMNLDGE
ncbi:11101_t:CDS:2, partial [Ambispora gerdemannii]